MHTFFRAFSSFIQDIERGVSYLKLRPDRVAMQDATAQVHYIFSNNSSLWCLTFYGLPLHLPYIVVTYARIDSIKRVCSELPCCPGAFSDLSSVHDITRMRKSAPGQNVFKSTCRLKGSMQRKVCPLAWASDIGS